MLITLENLPMHTTELGDCMLWNHCVNNTGYPQANIDGRSGQMVRRHIFTRLLGKQIPRGCVVSSICDSKTCCNPEHLKAMLRGKVQERTYRSGARNPACEAAGRRDAMIRTGRVVLNWDRVREIRALPADMTHKEIAEKFNLKPTTVGKVRKGQSWVESLPASSVFSWASRAG